MRILITNDDGIYSPGLALNGSDPGFAAVVAYVEYVIRLLLEFKRPFLVNGSLPQPPIGLCWACQLVREYNG